MEEEENKEPQQEQRTERLQRNVLHNPPPTSVSLKYGGIFFLSPVKTHYFSKDVWEDEIRANTMTGMCLETEF